VAPLADDIMQIDKNPYSYTWNNPILLTDPDGRCPWCLGAAVGALVVITVQITANMTLNEQGFGDAFLNLD
jgi:hypothetical protein